MNIIDFQNISVSYGDFVALKDISLQISKGEKIALIGPSGAGKSTLLRKIHESLAEDTAFIHQDFALVKQLSVFHNVYMGKLHKKSIFKNIRNLLIPEKEELSAISPILSNLMLEDKIHEKTAALSGGQQQRTAIARAFYSPANIVLGDEPVSSQDPENTEKVISMIMKHKETVILSLHNVEAALSCAERLIAVKDGNILFDTTPTKISKEQIKELYSQ
ncbi:MAG: ATP-binding cassette domain-containing protein [Lentisphaerales bacterium]|nr:ATP-binding cassette domain-containing protein [Lentisphaerales bacterium]